MAPIYTTKKTDCDGCGTRVTLDVIDHDSILIGGECPRCQYYVTRYMPGESPDEDPDGDDDDD